MTLKQFDMTLRHAGTNVTHPTDSLYLTDSEKKTYTNSYSMIIIINFDGINSLGPRPFPHMHKEIRCKKGVGEGGKKGSGKLNLC